MSVIPIASRSAAAPPSPARSIRLAEVLSALTYALDLTEGQRPGHTLRTTLIAMRLGRELALPADQMRALYYASLLKDSGCSSNAARMSALFGSDDQRLKFDMRLVDWHDTLRAAARAARNCGVGQNPLKRLWHFVRVASYPGMTREIIQTRCERGAQIALSLGFPPDSSEAIAHVDEHWSGRGYPVGLVGDEIPILSRVLLLSQTVEAFVSEEGIDSAMRMARKRRGLWFDPRLVDVVTTWKRDRAWWSSLTELGALDAQVLALEPGELPERATDERLDAIARAFAAVIDAKTPFTYRHSWNVAHYATAIGRTLGVDDALLRDLLRAGLLHDIGKLGISNRILDKPAPLTDVERAEIMRHPLWTAQILSRVPAFRDFAQSSARHHERMDGTGYPWGLGAAQLDLSARILLVSDVYEALTADRPYRGSLPVSRVVDIMHRDRGAAFDPQVLDATVALAERGTLAEIAAETGGAIGALPPYAVGSMVASRVRRAG